MNFSVPILTAATYEIPESGLTLGFATGSDYSLDNVYTFTTTAPTHSAAQVTDGFDAVQASGLDFEFGFVISTPEDDTALDALFDAVALSADTFEESNRFVGLAIQSHAPAAVDVAGMAAWRAELVALAVAGWENSRVMVCAGRDTEISALDGRTYVRGAVYPVARRISSSPISEHLGKVASGSLGLVSSIEHDEEVTGGLESYRFTTLRTIAGKQGFYINAGKQMAATGSDYGPTEHLRVINAFAKLVRAAGLNYLNADLLVKDDGSGQLAEDEANAIDIDIAMQAKAELVSGSPRHATSLTVRTSRTNNFLSTEALQIEASLVPKGYARSVPITVSFSRTA